MLNGIMQMKPKCPKIEVVNAVFVNNFAGGRV
jgi:hypothetical protein